MIRILSVMFILAITHRLPADDWNRFRGPNGSGISSATTVPVEWTPADYQWVAPLPGEGHSSPVVWGDRLFVTSANESSGERTLSCLSTADGHELWNQTFPFTSFKKHKGNTYATNTAAVDSERVYVLWQSRADSSLVALDHDGNRQWSVSLGKYQSGHGTGSSPIVYDGLVIVCNDHDGDSFLLAVDARTGDERWRVPRLGDRACYSTPCVFAPEGQPAQIIFTHSYRGITGIDAATGEQHWQIDVFGTHQQRAVASPIIYENLVIGSSGFVTAEKNVVAVRPEQAENGQWTVKEIYRLSRTAPHVPTPLVYRDRLFLWNDNGVVTCVDARTGKEIWKDRVGGKYFGSPICVGGHLYAIDQDGVVAVIEAGGEYKLVAKIPLNEPSRSTPAVAGGRMYLRTLSRVHALGQ